MIIHTVWATRTHAPNEPELVTACDEFTVDANPEGFEEDWKKGVASWGSDLHEYRHVQIRVPYANVLAAFEPPQIEGSVV